MLDVFLIDLALKKLTFELAHAPERIACRRMRCWNWRRDDAQWAGR